MLPRVPISSRLRITGGPACNPVQETIGIIDSVHVDGDLPLIDVVYQPPLIAEAAYCPVQKEISIDLLADDIHFHFCHEVGHVLDHLGIVPSMSESTIFRASEDCPGLKNWRDAVFNSMTHQILRAIFSLQYDRYVDSLLRERELWARAYAQYIATKSRDPRLMTSLQTILAYEEPLARCHQWTEDEFSPILASIDQIFTERGWL